MTDNTPGPAEKQVASLLQDALTHLNRNEMEAAEAALDRVLLIQPEEPNAPAAAGPDPPGPGQRQRSRNALPPLAGHPVRPAACALQSGRPALQAGPLRRGDRRPRRSHPSEAELCRGPSAPRPRATTPRREHAAAEKAYRHCLRIQPNYLMAKQSLGGVLTDQGRSGEAERVLRQALAAGSRDPRQVAALQHNLGCLAEAAAPLRRSAAAVRCAQTAVPDMRVGRLQSRQRAAGDRAGWKRRRNAIAAPSCAIRWTWRPIAISTGCSIGWGATQEFLSSLDEVAALYPEIGELPMAKGDFLFRVEPL